MCPTLLQLVAPTSVESDIPEWNWGQKRARPHRELGLAGDCGVRARRMEPGGGTAPLGAKRAPHPHTPFSNTGCPGETLNSKTNRFFLKVLARNFSLCRQCLKQVVWLSDGAVVQEAFWRFLFFPSVLPLAPPLQATPHFPLRRPWGPVELYPALGRLLEISSAIWTQVCALR